VSGELSLEAPPTPLERVGLACARASFVALVVGGLEGLFVARAGGVSAGGLGLAAAGLWFPAALLALVPASALHGLATPKRVVFSGLLALTLAAALFARVSHAAPIVRAAPLEVASVLLVAWLGAGLQVEDPLRRPVAVVGIVLAVALQVVATRWIDAHRAFAGLLVEHSTVPRFMLRAVLRRFV
jgi:hypothetical protein